MGVKTHLMWALINPNYVGSNAKFNDTEKREEKDTIKLKSL